MTDEEIAVLLAQHTEQIKSLNHRSTDLWEQLQDLAVLTTTVTEIALTLKNMQGAQERIFKRLEELEAQPAEKWNTATKTALTAIVGTIAGALAVGIVQMIANNM